MFCPHCASPNPDDARYCQGCGKTLSASVYSGLPTGSTYGGFWVRVVAALIDGILISVVSAPLMLLAAFTVSSPTAADAIGNMLSTLLALAYSTLMESSEKQATVGKLVMGLKVTDLDGHRLTPARAAGRYVGKILSSLILGIGFLMVAFTDKKQGLHDKIAGTLVVKSKE